MTHRWKLPKGGSWPLRPKQLLDALDSAGVSHPSEIRSISWGPELREGARVLEVEWVPKAYPRDPWAGGPEYVLVVIANVPSNRRAEIKAELMSAAVPELVQWLSDAATAPEGWRIMEHRRAWSWRDGQVVEDPALSR